VRIKPLPRFPFPILLVCLALAGCVLPGRGTAMPTPPGATPTPAPTGTPEKPLAVLVVPADMAKDESAQLQTAVYTLAEAAGMRFQVLNQLGPEDLQLDGPSLKVVIAYPPDPGLEALAAAAPQIQFLAVSIPNLVTAPNLSTLGAAGQPADQAAFVAGYAAAMLSQDYRVGIAVQKDDPAGQVAEAAFANGMNYYCGLCQVSFPPFYTYPVHIEIPKDATPDAFAAYGVPFQNYDVNAVYVAPDVANSSFLYSLAGRGLYLISSALPGTDLQPNWIFSIKADLLPALQKMFPDLAAGKGGQTVPEPLTLGDVNSNLLSEGKQRLVQQVLDGLQAGTIGTGVTPAP